MNTDAEGPSFYRVATLNGTEHLLVLKALRHAVQENKERLKFIKTQIDLEFMIKDYEQECLSTEQLLRKFENL